ITWLKYFTSLGFQVTDDTEVVIMHPDYMLRISQFLKEYYKSETKMRILQDYLAISFIHSFMPYFDKSLFQTKDTEEDVMEEAWKRCTFYTNKALGFSTG
ncbi:unnamed protein product, partial [Candidula unifasciata]